MDENGKKRYCEKDEKCCPVRISESKCSSRCGPYNREGKTKQIMTFVVKLPPIQSTFQSKRWILFYRVVWGL